MIPLFYDLHIHSCLSPCGDDDMTPANLVGMAAVKGLDVIALTDHNSCRNCPAALYHGKNYGRRSRQHGRKMQRVRQHGAYDNGLYLGIDKL